MRVSLTAVLELFWSNLYADIASIRLICTYDYTIGADGERSETVGSELVTVAYDDEGFAVIKKENLGAEFYGTITPEEIYGAAEYSLGGLADIEQRISINRYTGSYSITLEVPEKNSAIVHFGNCTAAKNPLF